MVTDSILTAAQGIVEWFASLLPTVDVDLSPLVEIPTRVGLGVAVFFDMTWVLAAVGIVLVLWNATWAVKLLLFIWRNVPVVGGRG